MSDEEAEAALAAECPRRLVGILHRWGHFLHLRWHGRLCCYHCSSLLPTGAELTAETLHFLRAVPPGGEGDAAIPEGA